jgi:hypothetical protein
MNNAPNERWILIVPATPLLISLAALLAVLASKPPRVWALLVLTSVFPYMPLFGAAVLGYLFWGWRKKWVEPGRPHVLAAAALSLLDILIPLGVLLYVGRALRGFSVSIF